MEKSKMEIYKVENNTGDKSNEMHIHTSLGVELKMQYLSLLSHAYGLSQSPPLNTTRLGGLEFQFLIDMGFFFLLTFIFHISYRSSSQKTLGGSSS